MSERGSFITENIVCAQCLATVETVLTSEAVGQLGVRATRLPLARAVGGLVRAGGGYPTEEIDIFAFYVAPVLAARLCHPLRIAILTEVGTIYADNDEPVNAWNPAGQAVLVIRPHKDANVFLSAPVSRNG